MMEEEQQIETMSRFFKLMNKCLMVPMWRLGLGKIINMWPDVFGQIMVVTHTGRKSEKVYQTPLNYIVKNGDVYCIAAFGGKADWYQNAMANPAVEVWLPDGWWAGVAEDVSGREDRLEIIRSIMIASGFAAKAFENIDAKTIKEDELAFLSNDYKVVRIKRAEARTGNGGPGEFSWIWPIATMVLGFLLLIRPKKRR
ncbi:MAG: nitroreductase family deazaflavin-dependent oxidoreductase [Anaerolineae bacterium]|nr:nitroreductase family deazaflavin-dependent oxidoreductase [Anaerolineae bacterium]